MWPFRFPIKLADESAKGFYPNKTQPESFSQERYLATHHDSQLIEKSMALTSNLSIDNVCEFSPFTFLYLIRFRVWTMCQLPLASQLVRMIGFLFARSDYSMTYIWKRFSKFSRAMAIDLRVTSPTSGRRYLSFYQEWWILYWLLNYLRIPRTIPNHHPMSDPYWDNK